jgi:hypothetical protein
MPDGSSIDPSLNKKIACSPVKRHEQKRLCKPRAPLFLLCNFLPSHNKVKGDLNQVHSWSKDHGDMMRHSELSKISLAELTTSQRTKKAAYIISSKAQLLSSQTKSPGCSPNILHTMRADTMNKPAYMRNHPTASQQ